MSNFDININDGLNKLEELLRKLKELKTTGKDVGKPAGESLKSFTKDLEDVVKAEEDVIAATEEMGKAFEEQSKRTEAEAERIRKKWYKNRQKHRIEADKKELEAKKKHEKEVEAEILRGAKRRADIQGRWDARRQKNRIAADKKVLSDKKKHAKEVEAEIERSAKRRADIQKRWNANRQKHRIAADKKEIADKKRLAKETENQAKANKGLLVSVWNLVKAYGVLQASMLFSKAIRSAFDLMKTFDSLNFSMEKTVGTAQEIATTNSFLIRLAKDYGAELITLTNRYVKFFVAAKQSGVALKDTQDIFETFTKVSGVMGLRADELNGVFLALEQMLSKGKITTEELRRQLGERLPGAMGIMASSMGVSIEKLDSMMKKGEVLSAEVLPKFARQVEIAYGIDTVDKVDTLVAAQNRLTTAWQVFVKDVLSESTALKKAFEIVENGINAMRTAFGNEKTQLSIATEKAEDVEKTNFSKRAIEDEGIYGDALVSARSESRKELLKIEKDIEKKKLEISVTGEGKQKNFFKRELKMLEKTHSDKIKEITGFHEEIESIEKKYAESNGKQVLKNYNIAKENYEKAKQDAKDFEEYKQELITKGSLRISENRKSGITQTTFSGSDNELAKYNKMQKLSIEGTTMLYKKRNELATATARLRKVQKLLAKDLEAEDKKKVSEGNGKAFRERLKKEIAINEESLKNNQISFEEQEKLARINSLHRKAIAFSLNADIKNNSEKSAADVAEANEKKNTAITKADMKLMKDLEKIRKNKVEKAQELIEEELQDERDRYSEVVLSEAERYNALSKLQKESIEEQAKHNSILLSNQIEHEEAMLKIKLKATGKNKLSEEEKNKLLKIISDLKAALKALGYVETSDDFSDWIDKNIKGLREMEALVHSLSDLSAAFTDRRIEDIQKEQEALEKAHESNLERLEESTERSLEDTAMSNLSAEEKSERAEGIRQSAANSEKLLEQEKVKRQEQLEKRELKAKQKQAKIDKAAALVSIAINTAIGVSKATGKGFLGIPEIAWIIANGAVQTATVLATPIPQFAEGGEMGHDGKMMINDHKSGRQEFINRGGNILTTDKKNAIVDGKKGDIIYKDYNTMVREMMVGSVKSSMIGNRNMFSPSETTSSDFSGIESTISTGIKKGFKGVKNINHIQVKNSNHALYLLSKQQ